MRGAVGGGWSGPGWVAEGGMVMLGGPHEGRGAVGEGWPGPG